VCVLGESHNQQWGAIDKDGNVIVPLIYPYLTYDSTLGNKVIAVTEGYPPYYKMGFIDTSGNEVLPIVYDRLHGITPDKAYFARDGVYDIYGDYCVGIQGITDLGGNEVIIPKEWEILVSGVPDNTQDWLITVVKDGLMGFINLDGDLVVPFQYKYDKETMPYYAGFSTDPANNTAIVCGLDGLYGAIDTGGNVIAPMIYESIYSFFEGIAVARLDGKWGIVDKKGNEILPFMYDGIKIGVNNHVAVCLGGKWGLVELTDNAD
jgi:hypothetical protein